MKIAADRLQTFIERIERLSEERRAISADIAEVYREAKSLGFDVETIKLVIRRRTMPSDVAEARGSLLDVYERALGRKST